MSLKHHCTTLAVAALLTGCTLGPDYVKPNLATKPEFTGAAQVLQPAANEASAGDTSWWQGYSDPLLSHFVALALQQNLDIAQAMARIEQARAGLSAANVALLPAGTIDGRAARAMQSNETPMGQMLAAQPGSSRYGSQYQLDVGVGWELDLFGSLRQGQAAALASYEAATASEAATRLAVSAQTADIYVNIRGLQARLALARRQQQTQSALVANLRLLAEHGLIATAELQQAEGLLAQANAVVPALSGGLVQAVHALDLMLGAQPGSSEQQLAGQSALPRIPAIRDMGTPGDLLRRRPDLLVAERQLAAAHAQLGQAMAEYYPKFSLSGLLGSATALDGGNLFSNNSSQASAVLGLRWRLFDFGRIGAQIAQAQGREAELLAAYRLASLRATADVEDAFTELLQREQQVLVLQQGETALEHARSAAAAAYQQGVVSQIEVLQSDEKWLQLSDARLQAQIAAVRASIQVFKALGGGWNHSADAAAG